ncbi:MAG: Fic family protein [Crocinitomicaceae bacterium]|nr:Fic family protein [Crocinitomicaceae bacterium]MBK8925117.1 Fic family protein [Crocinitomicaceae bacterium]
MKVNTPINNLIIDYLRKNPLVSSKEIHEGTGAKFGYATVKRSLQSLLASNLIQSIGKGKGTRYELSKAYRVLAPIDQTTYFDQEIDERKINVDFNLNLMDQILTNMKLFSEIEGNKLQSLQEIFRQNTKDLTAEQYQREFERLAIDLSWKSSQIEGNTYTLLETERLIREQETAAGKTKNEAVMLLNHKEALDFILSNTDYINPLNISRIEDIHSILIKNLPVGKNIRKRRVGISGTNYKPLDNEFQIRDALNQMCNLINNKHDVFEKALLALVLISYIQPFEDGNKRTARIISNAILINQNQCPLSFRTVDSLDYKKAMLIFYEQNNISAFKQIFIDQFEFAVNTYF